MKIDKTQLKEALNYLGLKRIPNNIYHFRSESEKTWRQSAGGTNLAVMDADYKTLTVWETLCYAKMQEPRINCLNCGRKLTENSAIFVPKYGALKAKVACRKCASENRRYYEIHTCPKCDEEYPKIWEQVKYGGIMRHNEKKNEFDEKNEVLWEAYTCDRCGYTEYDPID